MGFYPRLAISARNTVSGASSRADISIDVARGGDQLERQIRKQHTRPDTALTGFAAGAVAPYEGVEIEEAGVRLSGHRDRPREVVADARPPAMAGKGRIRRGQVHRLLVEHRLVPHLEVDAVRTRGGWSRLRGRAPGNRNLRDDDHREQERRLDPPCRIALTRPHERTSALRSSWANLL